MNKLIKVIFFFLLTLASLPLFSQNVYISNLFFNGNFIQTVKGQVTSRSISGNWLNAEWTLDYQTKNTVIIKHVQSKKALSHEAKKVLLTDVNSADSAQIWQVYENDDGSLMFLNLTSNLYLINWGSPDDIGVCEFALTAQCSWFISDASPIEEGDANTIIVYTKPGCGRSKATIDYLNQNGYKYIERSTGNKANRARMFDDLRKFSKYKKGTVTLPVIIQGDEANYSIKNLDKFLEKL